MQSFDIPQEMLSAEQPRLHCPFSNTRQLQLHTTTEVPPQRPRSRRDKRKEGSNNNNNASSSWSRQIRNMAVAIYSPSLRIYSPARKVIINFDGNPPVSRPHPVGSNGQVFSRGYHYYLDYSILV